MKVWILIVLALSVDQSFQQTRNQQNTNVQSLSYGDGDLNPLPPVTRTTTTTTTVQPDTTTKKKGFFSGLTGIFKSKDKTESTTTTTTAAPKAAVSTQSTTSTSTTRATTTSTTPKVPARSESPVPPTRPPSVQKLPSPPKSTTTVAPTSTRRTTKDDFPALPGVKPVTPSPTAPNSVWGKPIQTPATTSTTRPTLPSNNAWGKPLNIGGGAQPTPASSTRKPAAAVATSDGIASDAELLTLSNELFSKDINNPFKFVVVNYQGKAQYGSNKDEASQPLLRIDDKLFKMSTVEKMTALFNNYENDATINEYVSPIERKEEDEFLDAILSTPVMRHAMNFLQQKSIVTADPQTHREFLRTIWFGLYSRGMGKIGSSGFEHVFVSEVKNGTVMGLHNWIYLSQEEKADKLNYYGWIKKIDLGNKGQIAKIRFTHNKIEKPTNSLFIGTSPELEMAIYSVCFGLRADKDCRLAYGGKDFNIVTHTWKYRGKNLIGSAYPEI